MASISYTRPVPRDTQLLSLVSIRGPQTLPFEPEDNKRYTERLTEQVLQVHNSRTVLRPCPWAS